MFSARYSLVERIAMIEYVWFWLFHRYRERTRRLRSRILAFRNLKFGISTQRLHDVRSAAPIGLVEVDIGLSVLAFGLEGHCRNVLVSC